MDIRQTKQGSHSLNELEIWTKKVGFFRFYPSVGHGTGLVGERLKLRLKSSKPKELRKQLTSLLDGKFSSVDLYFSDGPGFLDLTVTNASEINADLLEEDLSVAIELEAWLVRLAPTLVFELQVSPDASENAFQVG